VVPGPIAKMSSQPVEIYLFSFFIFCYPAGTFAQVFISTFLTAGLDADATT